MELEGINAAAWDEYLELKYREGEEMWGDTDD